MMTKVMALIASRVGIITMIRRTKKPSMVTVRPFLTKPSALFGEPERIGPVDAEMRSGVPTEDALVRHVAQAGAHDDRLKRSVDQSDGEDLIGMDAEDTVPDISAA